MNPQLPVAFIFSPSQILEKDLSKLLKEKGCGVKTITSERFPRQFEEAPNYIFLIQIDNSFSHLQMERILEISENGLTKTQIIMPYEISIETKNLLDSIKNTNVEIIYLQNSLSGSTYEKISEKLIRGMFSYGFGKRETVIEVKEERPLAKANKKVELPVIRPIEIKKRKIKINFKLRRFGILTLIGLWIISLPFLSLLVSGLALKKGFSNLKENNLVEADRYFNISKNFAGFSKQTLVIGGGDKLAELIFNYDSVGQKISQSIDGARLLTRNIFGESDFDLQGQSDELFLNLDDLNNQINFLKADTVSNFYSKFFLPENVNLDYLINYIVNARKFVDELPNLLGETKPANYLVILQDKKELRATGGKITKLGIFTFNRGRLVNKNMFDVGDAEKQFKGLVVPPALLQKYTGNNNWYMRDVNWDPEFSATAAKAEWFLQKELNQNVDGVIAIDSEIFDNINILNIKNSLDKKDVQIFSNNENVENILADLSWDGGFNIPNCRTANCEADMVSIIEDNLGGNSVNPDIARNVNLFVTKTQDPSKYNLAIHYENLSKTQNYRTYVRIGSTLDTKFGSVIENINNLNMNLSADIVQVNGRQEVGVLVQIPAGKSALLTFNWTKNKKIDFGKPGEYLFYLRRQAGMVPIPTDIKFIMPTSLTKGIHTSYNTSLTSDFSTIIKW